MLCPPRLDNMVYCFVVDQTSSKLETFNRADFSIQAIVAHEYTLELNEIRAVELHAQTVGYSELSQ